MPVNWKWCLGVALLVVGLLSHPGMAAKIKHYKDDQGILHICNDAEEAGKDSKKEAMPTRRRHWNYPATAPPLPPPSAALNGMAPAPVAPPPPLPQAAPSAGLAMSPADLEAAQVEATARAEEMARDQAVGGVQEQTAETAGVTPRAGQSEGSFGRHRGGGRR